VTVVSAERDLEFALAEQSRCTERFQRSIGTSGELSAYAKLVAASRRVSVCDQAVREAPAPAEPFGLTLLADATAPGRRVRRWHGALAIRLISPSCRRSNCS
jgi:hypothetical protein